MSLLFRIEPGFNNPGPSVNQLPNNNPSFSIDTFVPKWERKTKNESEESKMAKEYVLSLFRQKEDGKIIKIEKDAIEQYAKEDPTFGAIWKVLLEERSPLQAVDTIRGLCRARGNGKVAVPRPPPPPPRGLTEKQKDHFRTIFGGGRIIKKKMISDWLSSGNSDDVVWMEVLAIYKTDRSAKDAIRGFLNHEFSKA